MPEPITASVVAKTMAKGAIAKVGGKILSAIAPGVFSNDKDFEEIKSQLKEISKQLSEVLSLARSTFNLVEQLPNIVSDIVDEQTLYLAKTRIESSIQIYLSLNVRPNALSHSELTDIMQSWSILIDKEKKTTVINNLPRYGEYLLSATEGKLYEVILSGILDKQKSIKTAHENLSERIVDLALEGERIISSSHIKSGNIQDSEPWIIWKPEAHRTKKETRCISIPCPMCNGDISHCWEEDVPDVGWNNEVNRKNNRLNRIKTEIGNLSNNFRSLVVSEEVLEQFAKSLIERKGSIISDTSNLKIIESARPFTVLEK